MLLSITLDRGRFPGAAGPDSAVLKAAQIPPAFGVPCLQLGRKTVRR